MTPPPAKTVKCMINPPDTPKCTTVMESGMEVKISSHFKCELNVVILRLTAGTKGQINADEARSAPLFSTLACRMIVKT